MSQTCSHIYDTGRACKSFAVKQQRYCVNHLRYRARRLRAAQARVLRSGEKNCWLEITLDEGKNRQIRRMLAASGIEVLRLVRVAIGPLQLGTLAKGTCRRLTAEEKRALDRAMKR